MFWNDIRIFGIMDQTIYTRQVETDNTSGTK
jgi:hypothetical protein